MSLFYVISQVTLFFSLSPSYRLSTFFFLHDPLGKGGTVHFFPKKNSIFLIHICYSCIHKIPFFSINSSPTSLKVGPMLLVNSKNSIQYSYISGTKLGFTDTDSFFYQIPYKGDIYQKLKDIDPYGEWMDFSNYPKTHPNYSKINHLIPGLVIILK